MVDEYSPSPTRAKYSRAAELCAEVMRGLDMSKVSAATHEKSGRAAALALYETQVREWQEKGDLPFQGVDLEKNVGTGDEKGGRR